MNFKMTPLEKKWVLYDVGNSAFTMLVSTIFPIYFNYLAENAGISDVNYLAYWGYASSICTLLVALMGPTLGAVADTKDFKKRIFKVVLFIGVAGCVTLGFCLPGSGSLACLSWQRPATLPALFSMMPCSRT